MVTSREQIKKEVQHNKREHCPPTTSERRKPEGQKDRKRQKSRAEGQREWHYLRMSPSATSSQGMKVILSGLHIRLSVLNYNLRLYNMKSTCVLSQHVYAYMVNTKIDHFGGYTGEFLILVENPFSWVPRMCLVLLHGSLSSFWCCRQATTQCFHCELPLFC